jgi:hypothetical protein
VIIEVAKCYLLLMTRLTAPFRLAAWIFVAILVLITVAPPSARLDSGVPHHVEHFASFFIAGALWYMGYPRRLLLCLTLAVLFAGGLELLQMLVPGRHARLIDFVVDALAAENATQVASYPGLALSMELERADIGCLSCLLSFRRLLRSTWAT